MRGPLSIGLAACFVMSACVTHIKPYRAKRRVLDPGKYGSVQKPKDGSLFAGGGRGFFEDFIAARVGDSLVIRIDEQEAATRNATTTLGKQNDSSYAVPNAFGIMAKIASKVPGLDPAALLSTASDSQFQGRGVMERRGRLNATLPVRVRKILPNGDLFVEGTKVVMVGQEEHHIYVSGIVRPIDINSDNSVLSSRVSDAEIEYSGRGDISDQQRKGWLSRTMDKAWPL